jgi:hypothetical protein
MVEQRRLIRWHLVVQAVTEILAAHQQANTFPAAAAALVEQETEPPAESVLIQIFLVQLLCMAAVAPDQMEVQVAPLQVAELTAIRQQQIGVVVDHNPAQVAGLHLQVVLAL